MPSAVTDLFKKVGAGTVTTLAAPGKALAATSITVGATTNDPTDTGVVIAIRQVDSSGVLVPGTYTEWSATVSSGTTFAIVAAPVLGSDQVYPAGSTTQVYIPLSSYAHNKLIDGILVQHKQTGAHAAVTADSVTATGAITAASFVTTGGSPDNGWTVGHPVPTAIVNNGNRSYTHTYASSIRAFKSPGMRSRYTRTVASPTQCTSLNGTTQYYSKVTPAGMTFTDDFTVSAWVKLSSYQDGFIFSKEDAGALNGWYLYVDSSGRLTIGGANAGAGRQFISYQSVPLNKWVHVAATCDASGGVGTLYIDGVLVPNSTAGATTSFPSQTTLNIGRRVSGTGFFPGKIAQAAVYSAVLTQATIRASMNQTLSGTETSLISAYSFNNSINDLNTTNANNLTANGSALATNADSPFSVDSFGTPTGTTDHSITQSVSADGLTEVVQVPEGCTIPTSGGITAVAYSVQKSPYGMPVQSDKWQILTSYKTSETVAVGAINVWTSSNFKCNIPVGSWVLGYQVVFQGASSVAGVRHNHFTISDVGPTNGNRTQDLTSMIYIGANASTALGTVNKFIPISLTSVTTYTAYGDTATVTGTESYQIRGDLGGSFIFAQNAYL